MKKLIVLIFISGTIISCKPKQKVIYADKNNPVPKLEKHYDTTYVEDANGNLKLKISEIK